MLKKLVYLNLYLQFRHEAVLQQERSITAATCHHGILFIVDSCGHSSLGLRVGNRREQFSPFACRWWWSDCGWNWRYGLGFNNFLGDRGIFYWAWGGHIGSLKQIYQNNGFSSGLVQQDTRFRGYNTFFMLNSTKHKIYHALGFFAREIFVLITLASRYPVSPSLLIYTKPRDYKTLFILNSTEHKFIMLINIKMPTIVSILTFISMINTTSEKNNHYFSVF